MKFNDVALPIELHRNRSPFPRPVQRRFAKICRVDLSPLRGPEPDAGSIRSGKFQRTRDETPNRNRIDGSGEIRHDVVVMHTHGQGLSDLGILIPILVLTLTIPMGVRKKMKLDFSFEMVPVSNTCALDPLVAA